MSPLNSSDFIFAQLRYPEIMITLQGLLELEIVTNLTFFFTKFLWKIFWVEDHVTISFHITGYYLLYKYFDKGNFKLLATCKHFKITNKTDL